MKFVVNIVKGESNYGGTSPDVPNVFVVGDSPEEVLARFREALVYLFNLIREEGGELPVPKYIAAEVEIDDVA